MKKPVFLITAVFSLALGGAAPAQEATPTPATETQPEKTPEKTPASGATATPAASPSPAPTQSAAPESTPETSPAAAPEETPESTPAPASSDADLLPPPADSGAADEPLPIPPDAPLPTDATSRDELPNPDELVPNDVTSSDSAPPPPAAVAENKFQQQRKLEVRYQEVKLQALKNEGVRSLREQADKAATDEGKRQALREYYRLLFEKMVAIDDSLKDKCALMEKAYLRRLGQYRVEPTIPLHPPPTPEPLEVAQASPTPTPKPKREN